MLCTFWCCLYICLAEFTFYAHDDVSPPEEIVTYYKINDGTQEIYNANNKPRISGERSDNTIEFWSVDAALNEETHNIVSDIKIDRTKPTVTIETPQWGTVPPGDIKVSGTVYEASLGSGVKSVEIWFNGGKIPEDQVQLSQNKDYFEWHFIAEAQQKSEVRVLSNQYDIEVRAYDSAGNIGNAYVTVKTSKARSVNLMIFNLLERLFRLFPSLEQLVSLPIFARVLDLN